MTGGASLGGLVLQGLDTFDVANSKLFIHDGTIKLLCRRPVQVLG
jgi:hypothetical protein